MPTSILIKRSSTASAVPTAQDIATGELAVNTVDKRIFTNNNGTIVELGTYPSTQAVQGNATIGGTLGVTGATTLASGSVTGNFSVAGTLTVSTPSNSTDAASKGYVDAQVSAVLDGAPAALDTLNELAAALNDDANFATTVTNALATKLNKAGDTMTGTLDMGANKVTTTLTPTTDNELTRKGYVDSILGSATSAADSAAAAATSATNAANSASSAATSASAATTQASAASTSATNAASSATAAASSATSASNSATTATTQATNAGNSATAAALSESNAATSETNAAASAAAAASSYDSFDDRYLGAKASDPSVDNDGDPLITGALYFNTTVETMKIYDGAAWSLAFNASVVPQTATTGSAELPVGTTAQRDGTPLDGYIRYNSELNQFEGYSNGAWGGIGGGATGGAGNQVFVENDQVVTADYTIPADKNAMSTGPVTINSGVTVTVSSGSRYVII